jgi:hypothetical protein
MNREVNWEGWTLGDLAGELWARGIDINQVSQGQIERSLSCEWPEQAAKQILNEQQRGEF